MGDRRAPKRKSRPSDVKDEPEEHKPSRTPSRTPSRKRARKSEDVKAEGKVDEVVISEGNGMNEEEKMDHARRTALKRKFDHATTRDGIRSLETFLFYNNMLRNLISKPECEGFLKPVLELWSEEEIPDYKHKIKHPMDLGTVKDKMKDDKYVKQLKPNDFCFDKEACERDIRLIFENCMEYNDPKSELHQIAKDILGDIDKKIAEREQRIMREQENAAKKAKRDSERRRRKQAEEEAAAAAASARKAALALAKVKKEAEEAERRRQAELKRREQEWAQRMEAEKHAAVQAALQDMMTKQRRETSRTGRHVTTSSVSSDEHEANAGEITFHFVSTVGMEKKRGRKSGLVMELESRHDELMKRRKAMVEASVEMEKLKQIEMTYAEKRKLCEEVAELDFVRMKSVADIIAKGMNRPDILNEVDIDLDIDHIDNVVLREVQYFLSNPVATNAKDALRTIEAEVTDIESKLVGIRYQKINQF